jgi:hypothetical protein
LLGLDQEREGSNNDNAMHQEHGAMSKKNHSLHMIYPINREELFSQLSNAIAMRSAQDQALWTILGFFGATDAVLLSSVFSNGSLPKDGNIALILIMTGLFISFFWHSIQSRALGHIKRHEDTIRSIETRLGIPGEFAITAHIGSLGYERHLGKLIPARVLLSKLGWLSGILWSIVSIVAICTYHSGICKCI